MLTSLDLTSQAILDTVALSMRDGSVSVFDRSLRYVYASGPGLVRVGLSRELLVGRTLYDLYDASEVAVVEPYYRRAFSGEHVRFDLPVFGRVYEVAASRLTEDSILVLVQDVTEIRGADAQHEQQTRFTAVVAHELRQPLAPLRVAVDLMKRGAADATRSIPIIERQLAHLERLVGDLGDAAQLAAGHFEVRAERVNLTAVVDTAVRDAEQESGRAVDWHSHSPVTNIDFIKCLPTCCRTRFVTRGRQI